MCALDLHGGRLADVPPPHQGPCAETEEWKRTVAGASEPAALPLCARPRPFAGLSSALNAGDLHITLQIRSQSEVRRSSCQDGGCLGAGPNPAVHSQPANGWVARPGEPYPALPAMPP